MAIDILTKNDARKYVERLRGLVLGAKNFVLDDETAAAAAQLGVSHPELLLSFMKNARTPFEKIFLEWPLKAHLYAIDARV
ncbi:hypothetical protein, partial [Escherichia coli]|uniref:hypothetical protein n=1 Tax=Escherichia coli TaxID=562 RepID=UPI0013B37967